MTNDRAIHLLESMAVDYPQERYQEAINVAIEALKAQTGLISKEDVKWQIQEWINELTEAIDMLDSIPSAEPCNKDAISREGLLKSWEELSPRGRTEFDQVIMTMPALPSAEPKTGKWLLEEQKSQNHIENFYICSSCGNFEAWGKTELYNYCPNCGARMVREDGEA